MSPRYTIQITLDGTTHTLAAATHRGCRQAINAHLGHPLVSDTVVTNWMSRKTKSPKYDFITIHRPHENHPVAGSSSKSA